MSDRELLETLVRWSESAGSSLTALELDIARLCGDLEAMEARLMRRIETVLPSPHLRSEPAATPAEARTAARQTRKATRGA